MTLEFQKRLAADLMKCGTSRVRFDPERLDEIESAITRAEIKTSLKAVQSTSWARKASAPAGNSRGEGEGRKQRRS
jgi:large subunit ribosomal protein L19e